MKYTTIKSLLFFLTLLLGKGAFAQFNVNIHFKHPASNSDTIYYDSTRKLMWEDFKEEPVLTGNVGAITSAGFGYKAAMRSVDAKQANLTLDVFCFFLPNRSWVKPGKKTDYVLNHEQHHFDIAYIGTGMFIKKLHETELTMNNYRKMIKQIYSDTYSLMYRLQDQYDTVTDNGQSLEKQKEWDTKIEQLIQETKKYY